MLPIKCLKHYALSAGQVSFACDALQRLFHNCHWRKIDIFLIPAIRRATAQANSLLDELDALSDVAGQAIADVVARVNAGPIDGEGAVRQFCKAIDTFCDAMLTRLEREEHELFSLARTMISGEDWFAVANQMLAHDAYRQESRPARDLAGPAAVPADMMDDVPAGAVWAAQRRQAAWAVG
ncbi:hypothetical protein HHL21_01345 [Massilia sp. RP-1-19]|uniref:Hemerythrin-like domain-containing protein n=1 Tax=Massilia polaris TaxID=2728846 RepID=A0A848HE65_9BURK|nr:hypothetical protein [Massilia polaris]